MDKVQKSTNFESLYSYLSHDTVSPNRYIRGFPQRLKANAIVLPALGYGSSLRKPLNPLVILSATHSVAFENFLKQPA
jgi:hypothetical protein